MRANWRSWLLAVGLSALAFGPGATPAGAQAMGYGYGYGYGPSWGGAGSPYSYGYRSPSYSQNRSWGFRGHGYSRYGSGPSARYNAAIRSGNDPNWAAGRGLRLYKPWEY